MTRLCAAALAALALALAACDTVVPTAAEREAIEPLVRTFLARLAGAYEELDASGLEGLGAPRLIVEAQRDIETLRGGGVTLQPRLVSVEITNLEVFRHATAVASCTEVWDTTRRDAFSGEIVGRDPHSVLHSHLQLQNVKGAWIVLYREVEETATGPRLVLPTAQAGER